MEFESIYAVFLKQYIEFKRNIGYDYKFVSNFKTFDRFILKNELTVIGLTKDISNKWAKKRKNESDTTRYKRINDIRNFSIYLNKLGYESFIPEQIKFKKTTFTPYIFSKEEIGRFFEACDNLNFHKKSNTRYVMPVIFRMIYGCGLRVSEAAGLKTEDVNLSEKFIVIRDSKNDRDRVLPLSNSLTDICLIYREKCLSKNLTTNYFFSQRDGNRYVADTVYRWFRKILWEANISHGGKGKGPRVHDFRHTFSVHSLVKMSEAGLDLYYSLPILSKYLGHQSLEATDKYVRLTSDMYPELIKEVNNFCSYIFPEVKLP